MKPVLIPPSPPDSSKTNNSARTCTFTCTRTRNASPKQDIQALVEKIRNGVEEVTIHDIENFHNSLSSLKLQFNNKTEYHRTVPYLNRTYVKSCPSNPNVIVRYIGMVQDMLEPEYYPKEVKGVHTKYRDYYWNTAAADNDVEGENSTSHEMNELEINHLLEERQPLVVVPIPFTTKWFHGGIIETNEETDHDNNNEEVLTDMQVDNTATSNGRKRSLEYNVNANDASHGAETYNEGPAHKMQHAKKNTRTKDDGQGSSISNVNLDQTCDWWPKGCMGSDEEQCPILAKMYYDQHGCHQKHLQLNDVVEVFGMLCMDPLGATFGNNQQKSNTTSWDTCRASLRMDSSYDVHRSSAELDDFFGGDFMEPLLLPSPSLLPRLHVLKYNVLHVEDMANKVASKLCIPPTQQLNFELSDRELTVQTFTRHIFDGDKVAAEALLLTLMSTAERDSSNNAIKMPAGPTLGCASMNIVLSNLQACNTLQQRLSAMLELISPVVAAVDLSLQSLHEKDDTYTNQSSDKSNNNCIKSPTKRAMGRMEPSNMQLPKGSIFIINESQMKEGNANRDEVRLIRALSNLTEKHVIPYQFDGMEINFEADFRVVVLSSCQDESKNRSLMWRNKLLPCSLHLNMTNLKTNRSSDHHHIDLAKSVPSAVIGRIRQYISRCRTQDGKVNNIILTRQLLQRAQTDFVNRRQQNRSTGGKIEVTEEDFHRWLTLTRLQARSRISDRMSAHPDPYAAEIEDWDASLCIDDAMINFRNYE